MRASRKRPANSRPQNGETLSPELRTPAKKTNGICDTSNSTNPSECLICRQRPEAPQFTNCCGVIFCSSCLIQAFEKKLKCPNCPRRFESPEDNATPYQPLEEELPQSSNSIIDDKSNVISNDSGLTINNRPVGEMDLTELAQHINLLNKVRQQRILRETDQTMRHTEIMLDEMVKKATMEVQNMNTQLNSMKADLEHLRRKNPHPPISLSDSSWSSINNSSTSAIVPQLDLLSDPSLERIKKHKKGLSTLYMEYLNMSAGPAQTQEIKIAATEKRLGSFGDVLQGVAKFGEIKKLCTLNYDMEPVPQMSIVSSLEFDKDCERFVVAGVTKKIKIFHFEHVKEHPNGLHYPLTQLKCRSKISNISWNPYQKNILCSSDYDGHVTIWDTGESKTVRTFEEHEKRCWTVHFNNVDPNLIASGSDDSKVKLWNMNCERSVTTIDAKVNVCCVYFSPTQRHQLVFGSADHCVHLYDIRNTSKPLSMFKGHRKAVSYVRYISEDQVVSASTDSTLRVWSVKTGRCLRELKGHMNEKNFVGLSGFGDHIMCGSENNRVFFYYKTLSEPICSYYVAKEGAIEEENEGFVSSVCWKKDSDYALVANSQGRVQLLQIL